MAQASERLEYFAAGVVKSIFVVQAHYHVEKNNKHDETEPSHLIPVSRTELNTHKILNVFNVIEVLGTRW